MPTSTHDGRASLVPHERRWAVLAVLCLSVFLVVVDNTIVNVALPTLASELDASTSQLQWIVDAYALVFAGLLLAGGSVGDRYGRKGAMQVGLVVFAATSLWAAVASSSGELIAARAAMGVGAALVFPATLAILTSVFTEPSERAKAIGVWSATSGLAVALGPISGGFLLEHFAWGSIFLVNLPIIAVALIAGQRLVPTSRDRNAGQPDPVGVVLSIAMITLLVWTVIEAPKHGWTSALTLGGFAVSGLVLIGFIVWERRRPDPMLDVTVFKNPRFSAASTAVATAFFALFGFIFLVTQYFQVVRGYDTLSAGLHTLPFAITAALVAPISARLALRFGTKVIVGLGLVSMSAGFFGAATMAASSPYWTDVVPWMVLMAAGLSLTTAPSTEAIMGSVPVDKAGVGSAVNDTTREVGGTLGVAVVGSVFASLYGPEVVERLRAIGVPPEPTAIAEESVVAAAEVARQAPEFVRGDIAQAASDAFLQGMAAGCRVAGTATLVGAAVAFAWLPARAQGPLRPAEPVRPEPAEAVKG